MSEIKILTAKELKAEIERVKSENPGIEIGKIEVETRNGKGTFLLKEIDKLTYKAVRKVIDEDELRAVEVFLKGTYAGGDDLNLIINDVRALMAVNKILPKALSVPTADFSRV